MPCYYTGSAQGDAQLAASDAGRKVVELTRLLCIACDIMDQYGVPINDDTLAAWKARHEQSDADHRAILREKAMAKLTPDEKRALGLK